LSLGDWPRSGIRCYAKTMDSRLVFVLLGLLVGGSVCAEAYTWTDDDGIIHYSDRPNPKAKIIVLDRSPTRQASPQSSSATNSDNSAAEPELFGYQSLEVTSPVAEETLWNIEAQLDVTLSLTPALRAGHQVRVYLDGEAQIVSGTNFTLPEVHRGVHNLQVEVIDETGTLMIRNHSIRFYVQQNSVY